MSTEAIAGERIGMNFLDALVDGDNSGLSETMRLLSTQVGLDRWDPILRGALAGAVHYGGTNRREASKADRLLRHLFGDEASPLVEDDAYGDRMADRLRADLADLVPFGAGLHLVPVRHAAATTGTSSTRVV